MLDQLFDYLDQYNPLPISSKVIFAGVTLTSSLLVAYGLKRCFFNSQNFSNKPTGTPSLDLTTHTFPPSPNPSMDHATPFSPMRIHHVPSAPIGPSPRNINALAANVQTTEDELPSLKLLEKAIDFTLALLSERALNTEGLYRLSVPQHETDSIYHLMVSDQPFSQKTQDVVNINPHILIGALKRVLDEHFDKVNFGLKNVTDIAIHIQCLKQAGIHSKANILHNLFCLFHTIQAHQTQNRMSSVAIANIAAAMFAPHLTGLAKNSPQILAHFGQIIPYIKNAIENAAFCRLYQSLGRENLVSMRY